MEASRADAKVRREGSTPVPPPGRGGERRAAPAKGERQAAGRERLQVKASPDARNRQRWAGLSPQKRREIEKLYEALRKLSPEERMLLVERLRSLDPERRREVLRNARARLDVEQKRKEDPELERKELLRDLLRKRLSELPPAERERLRGMSPQQRRGYAAEKALERRKEAISRLPRLLRDRVSTLPPAEQLRFLRRYHGERAVERTFPSLIEREALSRLDPPGLRKALRPLRRGKQIVHRPEFLSEETWKRWQGLDPLERELIVETLLGFPGNRRGGNGAGGGAPAVRKETP